MYIKKLSIFFGFLFLFSVNAYSFNKSQVSGTLSFYNNTNETIDVVVNQDPSKGVPITDEGLVLSYTLVAVICSVNPTHCQTQFTSQGELVGEAVIDVTTGQLLSYAQSPPYQVVLNSEEVPLRTVTFNKG